MPSVNRQRPKGKSSSKTKKSSSSKFDLIPLDDIPTDGIKACFFGKSGTGKTRFAGTFAELGPMLHIICSGNGVNEARSIKGMKNITCVELKKPSDLPDLLKAHSKGFTTIVLDHLTEFCDRVLAEILGLDRLPEQSSWGLATMQQYGQMGIQSKGYLRELLEHSGNTIFLAQERAFDISEDGEGGILMPYVSCATTPTIAGWVAPTVDFMAHTFKRKEVKIVSKTIKGKTVSKEVETGKYEYCLRTGPDDVYITKFRCPPGVELPDVVVNPTYGKLKSLLSP